MGGVELRLRGRGRTEQKFSVAAMRLFRNAHHQGFSIKDHLETPGTRSSQECNLVLSRQEIRELVQERGSCTFSTDPERIWIECRVSLAEAAFECHQNCHGARAGRVPTRGSRKKQEL